MSKQHYDDLDPETQAEIEAMLSDDSLDAMMAKDAETASSAPTSPDDAMAAAMMGAGGGPRDLQSKDKVTGMILQVTPEDVLVELGPKQEGVCPIAQFDAVPKVGETYEFVVNRFNRSEGLYILARVGAVQKADWEHLEIGQVVEARVAAKNKGGLEMEVAGHRAFMPAGQAGLYHIDDLEDLVGQAMACEVIEFNRKAKNIVLSRKAVLEREREENRREMWEKLEVGQVLKGTVRKLMPFGAFVELGVGVDGLVHISDISYARIKDPSEALTEGQDVTVRVLKVDRENNRIGLGLKQLQDDPYDTAIADITPGAVVTGRITKILDFGAFVEIQPGVEGLIHISELSHDRVNRVSQVVAEDQVVTVQVLDVEPNTRRISLSLKAMKASEEEEMGRADDPSMAKLRAKFGSMFDDGPKKGGLE
ncbi:MAG: S1 RNA-binding domain-containing protein [Planctomycetes bacterium]|nr:S1 RNA-binding domain-containing protein [Planctomycetota bacterium]NOG55984.1 S1 RNA-binding domain-containing protein [Planctomycetota bacterium]